MPKPPLPAELQDVLARRNPAVMGTIAHNGIPHTVPTWYLWRDGRVLLSLDRKRRRLQHIRENPNVALTVLDATDWYSHISMRGRATLVDDDELADIDALSQHYLGIPYENRDGLRTSAWLEITTWHTWWRGRFY
jgi:PPOX class probable F420-dependent enzyme